MVATQNIDTVGPIWTFSLGGVLTFLGGGFDNNLLSHWKGQYILRVMKAEHKPLCVVVKCHVLNFATCIDFMKCNGDPT